MTTPWQAIRLEVQRDDRPHHIANLVLRRCGVWRPAVDVHAIATRLRVPRARDVKPANARQRFDLAVELGRLLLLDQDVMQLREFAASLLVPLWMLETAAPSARLTMEQLVALFAAPTTAVAHQLSKLS